MRVRRNALLLLLLLASSLTGAAFAQAADRHSPKRLVVGEDVDGDIQPGTVDTFLLPANAGDFVKITGGMLQGEMSVRLLDPAGKQLKEEGAHVIDVRWTLSFIAPSTGEYHLEIANAKDARETGSYSFGLDEQRSPTEQDRVAVLVEDAGLADKSGDAAHARQLYQQALLLADRWPEETVSLEQPWSAAAEFYRQQKDYPAAIAVLTHLAEIHEKHSASRREEDAALLVLYSAVKDYKHAVAACERATAHNRLLDEELLHQCAAAYRGAGDEPSARMFDEIARVGVAEIEKHDEEREARTKAEQARPQLVTQAGHAAGILALAFSKDGRELISAGQDGNLKRWQIAKGREVETTAVAENLFLAALTGDGKQMVFGSWGRVGTENQYGNRTLHLANGDDMGAEAVAISQYGNRVAAAGTDHKIRVWEGGQLVRTIAVHPDHVWSLDFVGKDYLVTVGASKYASIDLREAKDPVPQPANGVTRLLVSEDLRWMAFAFRGGTVNLRDMQKAQKTDVPLRGNGEFITALAFSADGRLAVGGTDGSVKLWDCASAKLVLSLQPSTEPATAIAFSPGGDAVAVGSGPIIRLFDTGDGRLLQQFGSGRIASTTEVLFDPQANRVLTGGWRDKDLAVWDLATGRVTGRSPALPPAVGWRGRRTTLSPDGTMFAVCLNADDDSSEVQVLEADSGKAIASFKLSDECEEVRFLGSDRLLTVGNKTRLIEWRSGQERFAVDAPDVRDVAVSDDGALLAVARKEEIVIWGVAEGRERKRLPVTLPGTLAFSPDGQSLAAADGQGDIFIWKTATWESAGTMRHFLGRPLALHYRDNVTLMSLSTNGVAWTWNTTARLPTRLTLFTAKSSFTPPIFTRTALIWPGWDGMTRVYDLESGELLASLLSLKDSSDWLAVAPSGAFDGSGAAMERLVAWHVGNQTFSMDRFFDALYTPDLVKRVLSGERIHPALDLAKFKLPPEVRIASPNVGEVTQKEDAVVTVSSKDMGGGIAEVRLFQNGKLVGKRTAKQNGPLTEAAFPVKLLRGRNLLRAVALSNDSVESNDDTVLVTLDLPEVRKPALHVVVVGINQYESADMDLTYARPDAESIAAFFRQHEQQLFREVKVHALLDRAATKQAILDVLAQVAKEAAPEDVVVLYFSGHGAGVEQQYYFIPADYEPNGDDDGGLQHGGISALALGEAIRAIPALKLVLVLDSCQSGAALGVVAKIVAFRSPETAERKATQMLARSSGVYLIAASTKEQYAIESGGLGHGILTYALLHGLGDSGGPPAAPNEDGAITMFALLQYVNQQVPELTEKYAKSKQYPVSFNTGMDFPIVLAPAGAHASAHH